MKLLIDQNISFRILKKISPRFPNSNQVRSVGLQDATDAEIWEFARSQGYTLVTFDSDFQDLSNLRGHPPKIILLRTGNTRTERIADLLLERYDQITEFIEDSDFKELACLEIRE